MLLFNTMVVLTCVCTGTRAKRKPTLLWSVVSVPIDSRYQGEFRLSHFRPVRDVTRITVYTVRRILHYGNVVESYRRGHDRAPLVYDPPAG